MHVAIQGTEASYHDIVARSFFDDAIPLYLPSFHDVFKALHDNEADSAVVAIENSLYGSIHDVYDLLRKYHFWIIGEAYARISHQLIGLPGSSLTTIKSVHSQAPAIGQCEQWLQKHLPNVQHVEEYDTAGSVKLIKQWGDPTKAAIASSAAAKLYNLPILAKNIEDHKENYTRFIILSKELRSGADCDKTSIILTTTHRPGSLHRALGVFAERNINLSKLESRHLPGKTWRYQFYLDVEEGFMQSNMQSAFKELEAQQCTVRLLGTYKSASHNFIDT